MQKKLIPAKLHSLKIKIQTESGKGKTFKRTLPGGWDDIPQNLRYSILKMEMGYKGHLAKLHVLEFLLAIPKNVFYSLDPVHLLEMANLLDFIQVQPTTAPLVPSFKYKGKEYHFPKSKFQTGIALEYPVADDFYMSYLNDGNQESLFNLAGTICRETKKDKTEIIKSGDPRVILNNRSEAIIRGKHFSDLPGPVLISVLMYFSGIKKYINDLYGPWLFKPKYEFPEDESIGSQLGYEMETKMEDKSKKDDISFGWWGVFFDVAESGVFGNLKEVYQTNFHTICMYLVKKRKESEEAEKRMKYKKLTGG